MKWLLKCFYGYRNLGDEMLFWGVLDYIDKHYPDVKELTVQTQDKHRMSQWFDAWLLDLQEILGQSGLEWWWWFVSWAKKVDFIEKNKSLHDNFTYDIYFFGGGEVFAESRWFYGGWNYLFRYFFAINSKPFVLLWGIETPTSVWQKVLYKYLLPKAKHIVCRDTVSYRLARRYNRYAFQRHDFAEDLVSLVQDNIRTSRKRPTFLQDKYILVNMIESMANEVEFERIKKFIQHYPEHQVVYIPCAEQDKQYSKWILGCYPNALSYDWTQYSLLDVLDIFAYAQAGIWCRLHFLLLLQLFEKDRVAIVYAEKVKKLVVSTLDY